MAGLVPAIHDFDYRMGCQNRGWMALRPGM